MHLTVTNELLHELGCEDRPIIPVLNKCDLVNGFDTVPMIGDAVRISAKTGKGVDDLLRAVENNLPVKMRRVKLLVPFVQAPLTAKLRQQGTLLCEEYVENGILAEAVVDERLYAYVQKYVIE